MKRLFIILLNLLFIINSMTSQQKRKEIIAGVEGDINFIIMEINFLNDQDLLKVYSETGISRIVFIFQYDPITHRIYDDLPIIKAKWRSFFRQGHQYIIEPKLPEEYFYEELRTQAPKEEMDTLLKRMFTIRKIKGEVYYRDNKKMELTTKQNVPNNINAVFEMCGLNTNVNIVISEYITPSQGIKGYIDDLSWGMKRSSTSQSKQRIFRLKGSLKMYDFNIADLFKDVYNRMELEETKK